MILTSNEKYARRARYLTTQAKDDEFRYIHNSVGYNYRLTNIQAALGVAQLEMLPEFIEVKRKNYLLYKSHIEKIEGLELNDVPRYSENNHWMYTLKVDEKTYGMNRNQLMIFLGNCRIQTRPVWYLNHWQKEFLNCQTYFIENAKTLFENTINLPCSVNLKENDILRIVRELLNNKNRKPVTR